MMTGGRRLTARLEAIQRAVAGEPHVRVGFLGGGAPYPDGTPVPLVAAVNEFGAPSRGQPPRPFFRNMIAAKSKTWPEGIARQLIQTNYDVEKTLERAGQGVKKQLQESIQSLVSPPLAASTVKRKGFDKPLIDTGHMLNSVDYEVVKGSGS